jgi:hypothetical protein
MIKVPINIKKLETLNRLTMAYCQFLTRYVTVTVISKETIKAKTIEIRLLVRLEKLRWSESIGLCYYFSNISEPSSSFGGGFVKVDYWRFWVSIIFVFDLGADFVVGCILVTIVG